MRYFREKSGCVSEIVCFCSIKADTMSNNGLLNQIEQFGREIIPADGHLYLYGREYGTILGLIPTRIC